MNNPMEYDITESDLTKHPKIKVELHIHLDGAVRLATVWELAQKKGIKLPAKSLEELRDVCRIKTPSTLENFLKPFHIFIPVIAGDAEAIERIAYEFCEDAAKYGIIYCEARYSPHLLTHGTALGGSVNSELKPRDVVMCVNRGLSRGSEDFKVTVKSILCCIRTHPEWSNEILDLCIEFQKQGVVGIDIAGDEAAELCAPTDFEVFKRAASHGIHRTVHAGEAGPAVNVEIAMRELLAERIGHGYHVVDDSKVYDEAKAWGVHFEACPYSSYLTGSVPLGHSKHPILRYAEDNISFSLSRDDPTVIQKTLDQECEFCEKLGLKDEHIIRANINAAMSCFLPPEEKKALIQQIKNIYGIGSEHTFQHESSEQVIESGDS